jgi:GxxExxY protein
MREHAFSEITSQIIGGGIEVHKVIGPGALESVYQPCLEIELAERRLRFETQRVIPLVYKNLALPIAYRVDLVVEGLIVVELKAVERIASVHEAQVLTYLRLLNVPIGLIINFNVPRLVDGVKRIVNPRYVGGDRSEASGASRESRG